MKKHKLVKFHKQLPKRYVSEQQILDELGIPDWRHMSKDKIMTFASQLPYMNPEVAKAAIAQFPEFVNLATELVKAMQNGLDIASNNVKQVNQTVLEQDKIILDALLVQLSKADSLEEKDMIINAIMAVSKSEHDLADKNAKFNLQALAKVIGGLVTVAGIAVVAIGGAKAINGPSYDDYDDYYKNDDEEDDDDE